MDVASLTTAVVVATATIVLVILTGKYVALTKALADQGRQSREASIHIDLSLDQAAVQLLVGNYGPSAARNLRIRIDTDVAMWSHYDFPDFPVAAQGIAYLPPEGRRQFHLGYLADVVWRKPATPLTVRWDYDAGGVARSEAVTFDLNHYVGSFEKRAGDPLHEIADAVKSIERRYTSPFSGRFRPPSASCPACGEQMTKGARKCPNCLEWMPGHGTSSRTGADETKGGLAPSPEITNMTGGGDV